jgi:hypothetical protein
MCNSLRNAGLLGVHVCEHVHVKDLCCSQNLDLMNFRSSFVMRWESVGIQSACTQTSECVIVCVFVCVYMYVCMYVFMYIHKWCVCIKGLFSLWCICFQWCEDARVWSDFTVNSYAAMCVGTANLYSEYMYALCVCVCTYVHTHTHTCTYHGVNSFLNEQLALCGCLFAWACVFCHEHVLKASSKCAWAC